MDFNLLKKYTAALALACLTASASFALDDQKFYNPSSAEGQPAPGFDFFGWDKTSSPLGSTSPIVAFDGPGVFKKVVIGTSSTDNLYVVCADTGVDGTTGNTLASRLFMLNFASANFINGGLAASGVDSVHITSGAFSILHPLISVATTTAVSASAVNPGFTPSHRASDGTPVSVTNGLVCWHNSPLGAISGITVYHKKGRE